MVKKIIIVLFGLLIGAIIGYVITLYFTLPVFKSPLQFNSIPGFSHKKVIGFLPYWLISKAQTDYSNYINTLTYFGLTADTDGTILKLANEQEQEPGWLALHSGKVDPILSNAKQNKTDLSLLIFAGDEDVIGQLMSDPVPHANNLIHDVVPIMKKYGFTDLNLDIESSRVSSDEARLNFTQFVKTVKSGLVKNKAGTLTLDISPTAFIKKFLVHPSEIVQFTDYVVIMGYDYHFQGSEVTGAVSPLSGATTISEFDVESGVQQALRVIPPSKIILGIPLYGYEWETIGDSPRSAVIPGTGSIASNKRVETFLQNCASCSTQFDQVDHESHVIYKDENTGSFHQIFYPDNRSTSDEITYADKMNLGGIAMWALGYEGTSILQPITDYKKSH